jgi:(p)ppGpp synthase/HD superfamily hydrolase
MQEIARSFAIAAHGDQKYGDRPYSYHLDAVAKLAEPYGVDAEVIAYLHDTVEDSGIAVQDIEDKFGLKIAQCVGLLTDEPGATRKERKVKTYAKLTAVTGPSEIALVVKTADRLANVRACVVDGNQRLLAVYLSEHPVFRKSAYRSGLCNPLWDELDELLSNTGVDSNR